MTTLKTASMQPHDAFVSLGDAFEQLADRSDDEGDWALFCAHDVGTKQHEELKNELASLGLRRFAPLATGTTGVVVEAANGQVVRISDKLGVSPDRAHVHEQIQPILRGETSHYTYEILPKLDTRVSIEDKLKFQEHVQGKNYYLADANVSRGDLGYLPDGTVIGVDIDAVGPRQNQEPHLLNDDEYLIASDQQSIFPYLQGTGFISKQEHYFPALMDGRIRDALSDQDISRLLNGDFEAVKAEKPECFEGITPDNLGDFIAIVRDYGWYPLQAQEIMRDMGKIKPAVAVDGETIDHTKRQREIQ